MMSPEKRVEAISEADFEIGLELMEQLIAEMEVTYKQLLEVASRMERDLVVEARLELQKSQLEVCKINLAQHRREQLFLKQLTNFNKPFD